jgi:hypothetical protein
MKHLLLISIMLTTLVSVAQPSPQQQPDTASPQSQPTISVASRTAPEGTSGQNSNDGTATSDTCLMCMACSTQSDLQNSTTCLMCRPCSHSEPAAGATSTTVGSSVVGERLPVSPSSTPEPPGTNVSKGNVVPTEWRTHHGAFDLHFETGGVFQGPTIVACDIGSGVCEDSGRTHLAGSLGATYWITPSLGLSTDTVLMDGGTIAGATENSVGAYLGLQYQRSRGPIRPYLEVAPGYLHSFTTGNGSAAQFNPDLASVKVGGGFRFLVGRRWGVKIGADALPSFSGIGHQTPVTVTAGWFWQSKGRGPTE